MPKLPPGHVTVHATIESVHTISVASHDVIESMLRGMILKAVGDPTTYPGLLIDKEAWWRYDTEDGSVRLRQATYEEVLIYNALRVFLRAKTYFDDVV